MSKKDFEAIARTFLANVKVSKDEDDTRTVRILKALAEDLADDFEDANPRFDRERFLTACGL